jgi:hypothetical protein
LVDQHQHHLWFVFVCTNIFNLNLLHFSFFLLKGLCDLFV